MVVFSFFHVGRVKRYPFLFLRWFLNNLFLNYFTTGELYTTNCLLSIILNLNFELIKS